MVQIIFLAVRKMTKKGGQLELFDIKYLKYNSE